MARPVPLRNQVVHAVREAIFAHEIAPGSRLVERELCQKLGVSRPLVREAIRHLEAEGLLSIEAGRGAFVATLTVAEAAGLYELRAVLEALAAKNCAERGTAIQLGELRAAFDDFLAADGGPGNTTAAGVEAKARFYDALFAGSGNDALVETLRRLHGRISLLRATTLAHPGRRARSIVEIRKILRAIERHEGEAAWKAAKEHVESAARVGLALLPTLTEPAEALG
jgi:DNA-binding GntR family transcriptional regulator